MTVGDRHGQAMRATRRFSLTAIDGRAGQSLICLDGRALPDPVDGVALEAQFDLDDGGALLWLTDDSPYDEGLHVYLLSPAGRIVDAVEAGAPYTPGILDIRETGPDWARFTLFTNATVYRLDIRARARALFRTLRGWRYKSRLARHRLVVSVVEEGRDAVGSTA
jgi:hypothetical protein